MEIDRKICRHIDWWSYNWTTDTTDQHKSRQEENFYQEEIFAKSPNSLYVAKGFTYPRQGSWPSSS